MKRFFLSLVLATAVLGIACNKPVQAPVPGSLNAFDASSYRSLIDAQAAINAVKTDAAAGKIVLTPAEKTVLNKAIADYNIAEAAWQAYHAGTTADTATLTTAINQLVADIAALGGK